MRVERIQPDYRLAEGTATQTPAQEEQKVQKQLKAQSVRTNDKEEISGENKLNDPNFLKALGEKVEQLNKTVEVFDKKLHFKIHDKTERIMVQVLDAETKEVLKEIPPEKILDIMARIEEMIGLMVDKKV